MSEPHGKGQSWPPDTYPAVPPDAKFRQDLQHALEQTHRQQAAQRKLGQHNSARRSLSTRQVAGILLLLLVLLVARPYWYRKPTRWGIRR